MFGDGPDSCIIFNGGVSRGNVTRAVILINEMRKYM